MSKYAKLVDGEVVGTVDTDGDMPAPWLLIPDSFSWAARPSAQHKPMYAAGVVSWTDARTLAQARAAHITAMRDARDAQINGTFTWDGSQFDADQVSQTRLLGAVVAASSSNFEPVTWRLADNTWRELSAANVAAVYTALQLHVRSHFVTFAAREAAINAATTVSAVDAVTWE